MMEVAMNVPTYHLGLQYVEQLVEAVYVATKATVHDTNGRLKFKYPTAADVAEIVSTADRPVKTTEVLYLWSAFGRGRGGFIDDVEYRKRNNIPLANPRRAPSRTERGTRLAITREAPKPRKPTDPSAIRLADVDRVLDSVATSSKTHSFIAYRNERKKPRDA